MEKSRLRFDSGFPSATAAPQPWKCHEELLGYSLNISLLVMGYNWFFPQSWQVGSYRARAMATVRVRFQEMSGPELPGIL